jgi:hypothetical protein
MAGFLFRLETMTARRPNRQRVLLRDGRELEARFDRG